jgi:hypothetical protein
MEPSRNLIFDIKSSEAIQTKSDINSKAISEKPKASTPHHHESRQEQIIVVNPITISKKVTGLDKYQKVTTSFKKEKSKPTINVNQQIIK